MLGRGAGQARGSVGQPEVGVLGCWPGLHLPGSGLALHVSGVREGQVPLRGPWASACLQAPDPCACHIGSPQQAPKARLLPTWSRGVAWEHWPPGSPQLGRVAWGSISKSTQTFFPLRPLERTLFGLGPLSAHGHSKSVHRALPPNILKSCPGVYM